jgi:hypothetical protein
MRFKGLERCHHQVLKNRGFQGREPLSKNDLGFRIKKIPDLCLMKITDARP